MSASEVADRSSVLEVVYEQVEAFNRHDAEAMAALVSPDFVWLKVAGDEVTVETRGRAALAEGMRSYFASLPSVRSEVEAITVSGSFVAIGSGRSGRSGANPGGVAVYEIRDGLIQRVWYYPAAR